MFCRFCGKEVPPGGVCSCAKAQEQAGMTGAPVNSAPPAYNAPPTYNVPPAYNAPPTYNAPPMNPAAAGIAAFLSQPLMLALAILVSVQLGLELMGSVYSAGILVGKLFVMIPAILICIGLWISWGNAKRRTLTTSGMTLVNAGLIISLIVWLVLLVLAVIVMIIALAAYSSYGSSGGDAGTAIIVGIIIGLILTGVLVFLYYNGLRKPGAAMKRMLMGQYAEVRTPLFAVAIMVIGAVLKLFSVIASRIAMQVLWQLIGELSYYMDDMMGNEMWSVMDTMTSSGWMNTVGDLVGIAVTVIGIILLVQLPRVNGAPAQPNYNSQSYR